MAESQVARGTCETSKRQVIKSQPPSGKLVLLVLQNEGRLSTKEVAEETLLPLGTVHQALQRLREDRLVKPEQSLQDGRVVVYEATTGA